MKKLFKLYVGTFILILFLFLADVLAAQVNSNHVYVNGYTRKDGTYVEGHYRTAPNSTNRDNFSTKGNTNPYTGQAGWIPPDHNYNYTPSTNTPSSYTPSSNYTYTPTSISSSEQSKGYWVGTDSKISFYLNGVQSSDFEQIWLDNDLYIRDGNYLFGISNYYLKANNTRQSAEPIPTWKRTHEGYFFFYNGSSLAPQTTNSYDGNDLIVKYKNRYFRLEDYLNSMLDRLLVAEEIPAYMLTNDGYKFYFGGSEVFSTSSVHGEDLWIFYDGETYVVKGYRSKAKYTVFMAKLF